MKRNFYTKFTPKFQLIFYWIWAMTWLRKEKEFASGRIPFWMIEIKKETSTHFQSEDLTQSKTRFLKLKRATRLSHMAVHDMKPVSWINIIRFWRKNQGEILITTVLLGVKRKNCNCRERNMLIFNMFTVGGSRARLFRQQRRY